MKRLTAQRPILYGGRMYQAGDTLPALSLIHISATDRTR